MNRWTLKEAADIKMANQIRYIFAVLRVFNNIQNAELLFEEFKQSLIDDYLYQNVPELEAEYLAR